MSKQILITGAFGQLGESTLLELQPHFEIIASGRKIPKITNYPCKYINLDITSKKNVAETIQTYSPEVIVHLAAITNVDLCETNKELAWNHNVKATENILNNIRGTNCKIIFISTDYVFDGFSGPYSESDQPNPINYYGKTKLAAENIIRGSSQPWVIIRTNVLYGNSFINKASFVKWVVDSLSKKKQINVVNDQFGNPTWTAALSEAIKLSMIMNVNDVLHYGGSEFISRFEFAKKIAKVFNLDSSLIIPIKTSDLNQEAKRPLKSGLFTSKIEDILGIRTFTLDYCLTKMKNGIIV
tara:strand:- start:15573 stop:16466 length:894 start_codon:yes stop_codon:yes gene_type:complete